MNKNQYNLLKKCSDKKDMSEWNIYRLENKEEKIDLKFGSLDNFYLLEADLSDIDLQFTSLNNTKMSGTNVKKSKIISLLSMFVYTSLLILAISFVTYYFDLTLSHLNYQYKYKDIDLVNVFVSSIILTSLFVVTFFVALDRQDKDKTKVAILIAFFLVIGMFYFMLYLIFSWIFSENTASILLTIISFAIFLTVLYEYYDGQQKSIAETDNPLEVINFNRKYLLEQKESERIKDELSSLESLSSEQVQIEHELKKNINLSDEDKIRFQQRLDILDIKAKERVEVTKLLEDRLSIIEKQEKEEELIKKSMDAIKESFSHIKKIEKSILHMNIIYGVLLFVGIGMLIYFGYLSYEHREDYFSKLKDITFSASLGVVIFYATPILFAFSIIIFGISNLNKNIELKEKLLEKRYLIELIESTFYAQIKIGGDAKEALQKLIDKLADSAFDKLTLKHNKIVKEDKDIKQNYKNALSQKRIDMIVQSLLKKV